MNRKWWKILLGSVAVLYLFTVGNVSTDAAAGTVTEKNGAVILEYTEIGTYRVKGAYKAPNAPSGYFGYVFAGWYTDKDLTTPLNAECDNTNTAITNSENKYYAKFVPKEILGVRVQVLAGTTYEKETTDVRFITTVDSGNYNLVGFDVELNGITYNGESNRVCKKLYVVNKEEILEDYLPQNVFHEMSKYFLACKLTDVKHADYGDLMKIRPYWVTLDGTKVYGDTVNKTVNQAYTSSTASVTATQLATFARDTSVDNSSCYAQGGCTDGTYYYQAFVYQRDSAQNDDTNDCVYIGKYTLVDGNENNRLIVQSENLDLHHANDMTYNKDLTYTGDEKKSGLLVICHNAPCYDRVSFVDPDTLEIVNPNGITDLSDNRIEWKGTLNEQYIQLEEGRRIFAIEYNSALKQYVVGISGGQTFRILAADFSDVYGKAFEPINNELANFTRQGVGADDKYIYFVLHNGTKDSYNGHAGHVITVYDWQGNAVKVINIVTDNGINVNEEPENISIYDNVFYVGVGGSNSLKLYQLNRDGWSTEIIPENEAYIGSPEDNEYYTTLEEAVQNVEAGETITIVAENVEIDSAMCIKVSNVTIKNETDKNVVIKRSSDYVGPVFENGAGNLVITRNTSGSLMFAGNNYAGQSYVQNISGGTMSLKELTFKNIETTESGAAVCATSGTVTIDTCEFKNNIARTNGGALCIEKQANAVVTNSKFITNKTINQMGGAIYNYSNGTIDITDCTFDGNSAAGNGGAIYHANGGTITLNNSDDDAIASIFQDNVSGGNGGAICIGSGTLDVTGYEFLGNSANRGGAVRLNNNKTITATFNDSVFKNNTAYKFGGAISNASAKVDEEEGTAAVIISSCAFGAEGEGNSSQDGGAIYNENSKLYLCGTNNDTEVFQDNEATNNGGAIYVASGTLEIAGYKFANNKAERGGAIHNVGESVAMSETAFTENIAVYGGAIYSADKEIEVAVTNSTFEKNQATQQGGAIYNASTMNDKDKYGLCITNCTFGGTEATLGNSATERGGAIHNIGKSIKVSDTTFANNTAVYGGAINNEGSKMTATSCHFTGNTSLNAASNGTTGKGGGAVNITANSDAKFDGTGTFTSNSTNQYGGAIYMTDSKMEISGYAFDQNSANYAGAVYIDNVKADDTNETSEVTIQDSAFTRSLAYGRGGAIYVKRNLSITNCEFGRETSEGAENLYEFGNRGLICGAIYVNSTSTTTVRDSNFIRNKSTGTAGSSHGGAIYNGGRLFLYSTAFNHNEASNYGGAIHNDNGTIYGESCIFNSNIAGQYGQVASIVSGSAEFKLTNFADNIPTSGQALLVKNATLTVDKSSYDSLRNSVLKTGTGNIVQTEQ